MTSVTNFNVFFQKSMVPNYLTERYPRSLKTSTILKC